MANIEHKDILDPNLHEPKGFIAASNNTTYVKNNVGVGYWTPAIQGVGTAATGTAYIADGAGQGTWTKTVTGLPTASAKEMLVADGAGNDTWQHPTIHGSSYNIKTTTPISVTYSNGRWVRVDELTRTDFSATAGTHPEMQSNTDGSLTYIGTLTRHFHIAATLSVGKETGGSTSHPVACALYHYDASEGTNEIIPHSEIRMSANSSVRASTAIHADIMMNTGDKLVIAVNGNLGVAGTVEIFTYYLFAMGMVGS